MSFDKTNQDVKLCPWGSPLVVISIDPQSSFFKIYEKKHF